MKTEIKFSLIYLIVILCVFLTGCGHFADEPTKSVWSGGLWIVPLLTGGGAIFFWIKAYKASQSGSLKQTKTGTEFYDQNVSITKTGWFYFALALSLITIAIVAYVNSGYWK